MSEYKKLKIVPISMKQVQQYVEDYHRHLGRSITPIFCVGCASIDPDDEYTLVGVAIVGLPLALVHSDGWTLEVSRCCTDGTKNANSMLYAACWRTARSMGYERLITYTHQSESGITMKATGWKCVTEVGITNRSKPKHNRIQSGPLTPKYRWEILTRDEKGKVASRIKVPVSEGDIDNQLTLFED